ncbi:hypothetical protein JYB64_06155 [Algoriphagus aestuarii]|nr:hypothetical protein [Algoriphagus aestuarii]
MGKLESSVLGKIKGKIGNLIFYERDGQTLVRKKSDPEKRELSPLQKYHQQVFKIAASFLKPFKGELNFTMAAFENGGKKGFHQGLSWLLRNGILHGEFPRVIPEKIMVSMGTLPGPEAPIAERMDRDEFRVSWQPNAWEGSAREGDIAYVLIYDPIRLRVTAFRKGAYRKSGSEVVKIPWLMDSGEEAWIYLAFYQEKKGELNFSNSSCLGKV